MQHQVLSGAENESLALLVFDFRAAGLPRGGVVSRGWYSRLPLTFFEFTGAGSRSSLDDMATIKGASTEYESN